MAALTILGITLLFAGLLAVILRRERLALFAPRSTAAIRDSARAFCEGACRGSQEFCPLGYRNEQREACPLWRFVRADLPTVEYGSPFAQPSA